MVKKIMQHACIGDDCAQRRAQEEKKLFDNESLEEIAYYLRPGFNL